VLIDWFTVIAQAINFLILLLLLKFLLFDRIVKAIDGRQKRIADEFAKAAEQQQKADDEAALHRRKLDELEAQRAELLANAREEADAHRKGLKEHARVEVDELQARWRRMVEDERDQFLCQLRERAGEQVCSVVRKVLADLADAELERQITGLFLERIRNLDATERTALADSIGNGPVTVLSTFTVPDDAKAEVSSTIGSLLNVAEVLFELDTELVCGIEIRVAGHAIGWNVDAYLDQIEQALGDNLQMVSP
jgi:F-type H+-transporting ATPase subunit b